MFGRIGAAPDLTVFRHPVTTETAGVAHIGAVSEQVQRFAPVERRRRRGVVLLGTELDATQPDDLLDPAVAWARDSHVSDLHVCLLQG